ncbi:MAG: GntR family transcriptional regulator [Lactobacillales bacterium]|jgi:GntR family transcriptional regulator|nr:GntR family transcriptional regulator [Lactobacillales bacterium]
MQEEKKPIYLQVAETIEERIQEHKYVSSQRLPSDYELAAEFSVSRLTVRKAIEYLIQKQLLVRYKNRGTYVMNQEKIHSGESGLRGFSEVAEAQGKKTRSKIIESGEVPFHEKLWETLEAAENEEIYHVKRVRYLDDEPMTMENLYIRRKFLPKEMTTSELEHSIFGLIEQTMKIAYSHQEIEAILATKEVAKLLEIEVGSPTFFAKSRTYSVTGIPILYDESHYRADKYTFQNTLVRMNRE